jgi:hypothetical protein
MEEHLMKSTSSCVFIGELGHEDHYCSDCVYVGESQFAQNSPCILCYVCCSDKCETPNTRFPEFKGSRGYCHFKPKKEIAMTEERLPKPRKPYTVRVTKTVTRYINVRVNPWELSMLTLIRTAKFEHDKNFEDDIKNAIKEIV